MNEEDPVHAAIGTAVPVQILTTVYTGETSYAGEIAALHGRMRPHVYKTVKRLEQAGYLDREQNGRRKTLSLTEKGRAVAEALVAVQDTINMDG